MRLNKKAKIVATVGPASNSPNMLRELVEKGVDTFRLNFSHGSHDDHARSVDAIRSIEKQKGYPIGILADLQGPKIRLGRICQGKSTLAVNQRLHFVLSESSESPTTIPMPHREVFEAIETGHQVLINDGRVKLKVVESSPGKFSADVVVGGEISDRKGVNLPDTLLNLPALTEKDLSDLTFALEQGADWIALSFVQRGGDIDSVREHVCGKAGLVAKIEKPSALLDLRNVVEKSDAIMVARGDLGVEIPPEDVPEKQSEIISLCRSIGRPVIVATQMLESMIHSAVPTRAEVSDVATAINEGADAVMLSAESAAGEFPVEAVAMMARIISKTEVNPCEQHYPFTERSPANCPGNSVARAATLLAREISAAGIVAYTTTGATAIGLAAQRPVQTLFAFTPSTTVARRLCLAWGIRPIIHMDACDHTTVVDHACRLFGRILPSGGESQIVIVSGTPFGLSGSTNNIRVADLRKRPIQENAKVEPLQGTTDTGAALQ